MIVFSETGECVRFVFFAMSIYDMKNIDRGNDKDEKHRGAKGACIQPTG